MKRNKIIPIRVSILEKEKIEKNAKKCGLDLSKYIRKQCIENSPVFIPKEVRDEMKELKKIGLEITRTLNLYHKKRKKYSFFHDSLRRINAKINT